ncbi:unnamed protein product [Sphagnum troendelagicum]|uniref:Uncharacterized protein n=1 Tax=Sphagnum troendelagicum TaxID=128251 RepID=A0ABP0TEV7_9BRYO
MGQWGARAGKEGQGRKSRAGGLGHCGAPGPAKCGQKTWGIGERGMEGQGRKTRAALWTTAAAFPNEGCVGQPANDDKVLQGFRRADSHTLFPWPFHIIRPAA